MKDSGIEWIGDIPADWNVIKTKHLCDISTGNQDTINRVDGGDYPFFIRSKNVERINTYSFDGEAVLTAGDGDVGKIFHYIDGKFDYHQRVYKFSDFRSVIGRYFYYYISSNLIRELGKYNAKTTVESLRLPWLKEFPVIVSKIEEQQQIAQYLDDKVGQIDSIIEKTKSSIEEYKKYKQSIMTETVTKGLDPTVMMKDSGVEWIGDIPEHWDMVKIKSLLYEINERNVDENAVLLSLFTALGVAPRSEMEEKGNKAVTVINYKIVKRGDLIVNKLLAWMGAIAFSDYEGVTSPDYDVYRFHENAEALTEFYEWYFRFTKFKDDCYKFGRGIMMMRWRTYPAQFKNIYVVNPPLEEQKQIIDYLKQKIADIDQLIDKKQRLITELESYKKSLIYEVVTGKKEIN